jgi:hypothetical protein
MKTLFETIEEIKKHLVASDGGDTDGVILIYHQPDKYEWRPVTNEEEGIKLEKPTEVFIPFKQQHRCVLRKVDPLNQEYLIAVHIADIALTLMAEDRKQARELLEKYRKELKDKAKKV